jgi:hypothetical protein
MLPGLASAILGIQERFTFVGYAEGTQTSTSNTTLSLSSGLSGGSRAAVAAGDLVVAVYAICDNTVRTATITDGTDAYTDLANISSNNNRATRLRVAYKVMGGTPDASVTFGGRGSTAASAVYCVLVFSGQNASVTDATTTTATGVNTSRPNPPAITPVTPGAFIFVIGAVAHGDGVGGSFSFSGLAYSDFINATNTQSDNCLGVGLKTDWTSGAYDHPAFTYGGAGAGEASFNSWAAVTVALRPA